MIDVHKLAHYLCERRADRQDDAQPWADPYKIKSPRWADLTPAERMAYVVVANDVNDFLKKEQQEAMRRIKWE